MSERTRRPWAEPAQETEEREDAPLLRVLKGAPQAEELVALTAVVAALASAPAEQAAPASTRTEVLRRAERLRSRVLAVPGAWRSRGR